MICLLGLVKIVLSWRLNSQFLILLPSPASVWLKSAMVVKNSFCEFCLALSSLFGIFIEVGEPAMVIDPSIIVLLSFVSQSRGFLGY